MDRKIHGHMSSVKKSWVNPFLINFPPRARGRGRTQEVLGGRVNNRDCSGVCVCVCVRGGGICW